MLFEKNITFDVKVEFEAPFFGYNVDEVFSPVINRVVKKTLKKFLNSDDNVAEYTENNVKNIITKIVSELRKSNK